MSIDDYFEKLGLKKGASAKEITRAYHKKAKEVHPDTSSSEGEVAEEDFKQLNKAYLEALKHQKSTNSPPIHTSSSSRSTMGQSSTNPSGFEFRNFSQIFDDILSTLFRTRYPSKFSHRTPFHQNASAPRFEKSRSSRHVNRCGKSHAAHVVCLICENQRR